MYFEIIFKTIFMYSLIIIAYRVIYKQEIKELSILDLIVSILIAELVGLSIENYSNNILIYIIPILVLMVMQMVLKYLDNKSNVIIKDGKVNFKEIYTSKYSLEDLISNLKAQGIKNIDKVKSAKIDNNKLSILNYDVDYPLTLIQDGVIEYNDLKKIGKDYDWILNILKKRGLNLEDVFYAFYLNGKTFIIEKKEVL